MNLHFYKMHGCGNDFLFLDYINGDPVQFSKKEVAALCHRQFGVGADGLVVLHRSQKANAGWTFFNKDGSEAEMCGNAARCAILFLADRYFADVEPISLETRAGILKGRKVGPELSEITLLSHPLSKIDYTEKLLKDDFRTFRVYCVNTGVPHAVLEVDDIRSYPISEVGRWLLRHSVFQPDGTNVTFFQKMLDRKILSTTFERGVGRETFACGTGASAAALMFIELYMQRFPIEVEVPGGILVVDMSPHSKMLLLRGPAQYVAEVELQEIPRWEESLILFENSGVAR